MSTESKTPRTDTHSHQTDSRGVKWKSDFVPTSHAEQLETELAEAQAQLDGGIHTCSPQCQRVECVLRRELAEARRELEQERTVAVREHQYAKNQAAVTDAIAEADKWRVKWMTLDAKMDALKSAGDGLAEAFLDARCACAFEPEGTDCEFCEARKEALANWRLVRGEK